MRIALVVGVAAIVLYFIFYGSKTSAASVPIVTTPSTQIPWMLSFFASPSPIIKNASLNTAGASTSTYGGITTGPTLQQALPTDIATPAAGGISPSLLVPLNGDPAVTSVNDINSGLDYPGIQTYMTDPSAPDPNLVLA